MGLFKKKMTHQVTGGGFWEHLEVMRANYRDNPLRSKSLPKPLWIRLHRNDGLNVVYRDKDTLLSRGEIYYGYVVQANEMLFREGSNLDLPANIIYSTHPIAAEDPGFLSDIGSELFRYKGMPEEEVPEDFREIARILEAETDRSGVDFYVELGDPDDPDGRTEKVDIHFCSVIVFYKDLPHKVLSSQYVPVIAAPGITPAVMILPKEYWTADGYYVE